MSRACSKHGIEGECRVLLGNAEGKKSLGKLRRRWQDNEKMDLREISLIHLAQDWDQWWALVNMIMNVLVT
jgi:hypothetical protein